LIVKLFELQQILMHRTLLLHPVVLTDEAEKEHVHPFVAVPDRFTPILFVNVFGGPGYRSAAPVLQIL
jgi:hypothetical protein